ncbi:proton-transporting ATPase activity, rotational mechanism [Halocaridina rubra]|uniref:Proton-transporting ATPase activity, rotational mechanism n=1 Tax=Halocaridina rubra TaxID=373956 RepID=A0AAN8WUE9_HALRR
MSKWLGSLFFLYLSLCHNSFAKDHVPVVIWNTNQVQGSVPSVSALQYITYPNFQAKYLASFKPNNILLFLQDALSIEDLTSHTSELHHIKEWMESGHSLFLPNVEDAAHLVHDLPSHGYNVVKLEHDAGLTLKQEDKNLVVVELPSTLTNPSRRRAMQKADEVMENVISKIGAQRDFTIIFTGSKPSVEQRNDQFETRLRVARSLQAAAEPIKGFHLANCTKMYLRKNITINLYKGNPPVFDKSVEIPENNAANEDTGDCQSDSAILMVKYNDVVLDGVTYKKAIFSFRFELKGGSWIVESVSASFDTILIRANYKLDTDMDWVPVGMSFACSEKFIFIGNDTLGSITKMDIVLEGFQVQSFQTLTRFDGAWDCVGFFTVPIWCGLLITLLLVIILTIGLFMLSDIKTMDRFDDPKGQPISVPSSE